MWNVVQSVVCKLAADVISKVAKTAYKQLRTKKKSGTGK